MEKGNLILLLWVSLVGVALGITAVEGTSAINGQTKLRDRTLPVDNSDIDPETRKKRCEDGCEDGPSASSKGAVIHPIPGPGVIKPPGKPKPPPASPRGGPPPASPKGGPPPASHKAPLSSRGGGGGGGSGISCQCDCDGLPLF